jgi:predicted nucleotidyltransferase
LVPAGNPDGLVTDLLFASSGIEPEVVSAAEMLEVIAGLVMPVATVGHLVALKLLARDDRNRPLDADDLRALAAVATETDWAVAETAVMEIESRGYARGRELVAALATLRSAGAY